MGCSNDIPANASVRKFEVPLRHNIMKHLEGSIDDVISTLKEIRKESVDKGYHNIRIQPEYTEISVQGQSEPSQKLTSYKVYGSRQENPDEYWARVQYDSQISRQERRDRYRAYRLLKKEFEGIDLEGVEDDESGEHDESSESDEKYNERSDGHEGTDGSEQ